MGVIQIFVDFRGCDSDFRGCDPDFLECVVGWWLVLGCLVVGCVLVVLGVCWVLLGVAGCLLSFTECCCVLLCFAVFCCVFCFALVDVSLFLVNVFGPCRGTSKN